MPVRYICKKVGCSELVNKRGDYCDLHFADAIREADEKRRRAFASAERPNRKLYNSRAWRTLRAKIIERDGYCQRCGSLDQLQVHHIRPPRGDERLFYAEWNLEVICSDCHRVETAAEIRERQRGR
jgi:5-methylcytosine-specific restriction endonuclease McrA